MSLAKTIWTTTIALGLGIAAGSALSQEPPPEPPVEEDTPAAEESGEPSMEEQMAAYMKAIQLNENHRRLGRSAGTWTVTTKSMMAPGAPPAEDTGTATFTKLMGGRYVQQELTGAMMGMPFHGIAIDGYDNQKQKYVGAWIDNFGTGVYTTEGTWDEETQTFTHTLSGTDPMTGGELEMRITSQEISADEKLVTMHMLGPDGTETKTMEARYTRQK